MSFFTPNVDTKAMGGCSCTSSVKTLHIHDFDYHGYIRTQPHLQSSTTWSPLFRAQPIQPTTLIDLRRAKVSCLGRVNKRVHGASAPILALL
jgi:hypothetical protein